MKTETRQCQNCSQNFTIEGDDFLFYERIKTVPPTWCPECRMQRRLAWRNERHLYRRKDALTGKDSFSGFPAEADIQTYENSYWNSDAWDPMEYATEYDFSKPFFEQFKELLSRVPLPAKSSAGFMINSDYCNEAGRLKNAYLCFDTDFIEDSAYLVKCTNIKDSLDSHEIIDDELCYEDVMVYNSYRTFFSLDCESCADVWFSKGLRGCTNCFGCVNLKGKSYYYFNEPLTKEAYQQKINEFTSSSHTAVEEMKQKTATFWMQFPVKYYHGIRNVDCTGDRIADSKDVKESVSIQEGEHLRYCQIVILKSANSQDASILFMGAENIYETIICGEGAYNLKYCFNCWAGPRDLEYCGYCVNSADCFGCVGISKKQYCILNKQYTKEEYFDLVEKIKNHMNEMPYIDAMGREYKYGQFFPAQFSPFAYNESLAVDYIPLSKNEAVEKGFLWKEPNVREFQTTKTAHELPDDSNTVSEEILGDIIACETCRRAYRIIPMELQFYKRMRLPLPHLCPECRFIERAKYINKPKLYSRTCMCSKSGHDHTDACPNKFETTYPPDRKEIVFCESCYQNEVN